MIPSPEFVRRPRAGLPNTGDKLRSSIACAGFVCFIPLFGSLALLLASHCLLEVTTEFICPNGHAPARRNWKHGDPPMEAGKVR